MNYLPVVFAVFLALCGCATRPIDTSVAGNTGDAAVAAVSGTRDGLAEAALSPLEDFNLKRTPIPALLEAMESPYHGSSSLTCPEIDMEISQLDGVLGPDWDTPAPDDRLRTEKLGDAATDAALGAVRSSARGWIPFRGIVRMASGADSHEKRYNRAYKIGAQRRTYLKGYGLAKGCAVPAAPDFDTLLADDPKDIVFK